jgi:predicted transcriptional regulator
MVTTTVSLEDATYQRLRHLAVDERTNVRELIREAITDLLKRRERR